MVKKFKPGDLVISRVNFIVENYPYETYAYKNQSVGGIPFIDYIRNRSSVKFIAWKGVHGQKKYSVGTVGIVSKYENVFMLDNRKIWSKSDISYVENKENIIRVDDSSTYQNVAAYENYTRQYLHVLIDDMQVACNSPSMFVSVDEYEGGIDSVCAKYTIEVTQMIKSIDNCRITDKNLEAFVKREKEKIKLNVSKMFSGRASCVFDVSLEKQQSVIKPNTTQKDNEETNVKEDCEESNQESSKEYTKEIIGS